MKWKTIATDLFKRDAKRLKKRRDLWAALDKKIQRLKTTPEAVGKRLSGNLHGLRSTRLLDKWRLAFQIDAERRCVYLLAIDHRKHEYGGLE